MEKTGQKGTVQYPKETEHFVVPPEVEAVYGPTPIELDVMFPHDDPEVVFVQKLARYGSSAGLKCHGNGEEALELNEHTREWMPIKCPCEHRKTDANPKGDCDEQSSLMVLLPRVSMGGCYQITTRSYHSTVTLNSALDYIRAIAGRIALIPLKLRRKPRETHHNSQKQTHHTLNLILDADYKAVRQLRNETDVTIPAQYLIEGPADENPELDPPDVHEVDAEELAKMNQAQLDEVRDKMKQQPHETATEPKAEPANGAAWVEEESKWKDMVLYMDEDPARAKLLKAVKETFHTKNASTLPVRQRAGFLNTLNDKAKKQNITLQLG